MGRRRKQDKHFPRRWRRDKGRIYYIVPPGQESQWNGKKWFFLGNTEPEAYRTWAKRIERAESLTTMADLFEKYLLEYTPTKRPKTQKHHKRAIANLAPVFGHIPVNDFESKWGFQYYERRKADGISAANQDIKTLSHVFTMAVQWGVINNSDHPLRGLKIKQSDPVRSRYVEDWELIEALKVADDFLTLYIAFKLMSGMDKSTILSIKRTDITPEGIQGARVKTKSKPRLYEFTPELKDCVNRVLLMPRPIGSMWLFCNTRGQPYINEAAETSGFDSKWRRFMTKALAETKLKERFTEHDLRAKAASDSESLEFAQALLGHSDPGITRRVYRRKIETVKTRALNVSKLKGEK